MNTFSLQTVTHLDTWLASSCTRVTIWSILDLGATSYSSGFLAKLLMHDITQCIAALERDLFWVARSGTFVYTFPVVSPAAFTIYFTCFTVYVQVSCLPSSSSGQLGNDYLTSSSAMSLFWRSLITWSPGLTSGDFICNPVTAGLGMLEIGARQLHNWGLHKPPDFLSFCQSGVLSTRLYCSLMPRHHFRLPGRYNLWFCLCGHLVLHFFLERFWKSMIGIGFCTGLLKHWSNLFYSSFCPEQFEHY